MYITVTSIRTNAKYANFNLTNRQPYYDTERDFMTLTVLFIVKSVRKSLPNNLNWNGT